MPVLGRQNAKQGNAWFNRADVGIVNVREKLLEKFDEFGQYVKIQITQYDARKEGSRD